MQFVIKYEAVCYRLNGAPVKGFEKDVGSKTTLRITYPEGAIQKTEHYEDQSLFVLSAFKAQDFKWLRHMVYKQNLVRLLESAYFVTTQLIAVGQWLAHNKKCPDWNMLDGWIFPVPCVSSSRHPSYFPQFKDIQDR